MGEPFHLTSGARTRDASTRVINLATRQAGVIARWQLEDCGMTSARIARWLAAGRLHRVHPAVYVLGHRYLGDRGRLIGSLFYAGRGSALSHAAGAWWLGLRDARPDRVDICTPRRMRSLPEIAIHRPRSFERFFHLELPVVRVPILLMQLAASLPPNALRRVLARADFLKLLEPNAIHAAIGQGREGSSALRRALRIHLPLLARTQNDFEAEFVFLCERFGLPLPEVNVPLGRFRPDMLWRDLRLIVELDGKDAHTKPGQIARDHKRDMILRSWGYAVIRYTWEQVHFEPEVVAADLRTQMARADGG